MVALNEARIKARDSKRMMEIAQFGRILTGNCYLPDAGPGDYDIADIIPELIAKNEQYAQYLAIVPQDPNGSSSATLYRYLVSANKHCALYANLENANESVTLTSITTATVDSGTGVFQAAAPGVNGTDRYFQVSN